MSVIPILMAARAVVDLVSTAQPAASQPSAAQGASFAKALQRVESSAKPTECQGVKVLSLIQSLPEVAGPEASKALYWQVDRTGALRISQDGENFIPVELTAGSRSQLAEVFEEVAGKQLTLSSFSQLTLHSQQPANIIWQRMKV